MSAWIVFADGNRRDGVGDLLEIGGIDTSRHRKNPIVLFDHGKGHGEYANWPIAQNEDPETHEYTVLLDPALQVGKSNAFFYQGKGIAGVEREKEEKFALICEQLFDLIAKRFVRAGSIGYQVKQARELWADESTGIPKGLHLLLTLMLENSAVVLPANGDTVNKGLMPDINEVLCIGAKCCGKPLSPYLVKSLTPYAASRKVQMGYEVKCGGNCGCHDCKKKFDKGLGEVLKYSRDLESRLRNVSSLPHGTGARYLECIKGPEDELIAKAWRRDVPADFEVLIDFGRNLKKSLQKTFKEDPETASRHDYENPLSNQNVPPSKFKPGPGAIKTLRKKYGAKGFGQWAYAVAKEIKDEIAMFPEGTDIDVSDLYGQHPEFKDDLRMLYGRGTTPQQAARLLAGKSFSKSQSEMINKRGLNIGDIVHRGTDPREQGFNMRPENLGTVVGFHENAGVSYADVKYPSGRKSSYATDEWTKIEDPQRLTPNKSLGHKSQPSDKIKPAKARQILKDDEANGKPLTEKQRGMFGAAAGRKSQALRAKYKSWSWEPWKHAVRAAYFGLRALGDAAVGNVSDEDDNFISSFDLDVEEMSEELASMFDRGASPQQAARKLAGKHLMTYDAKSWTWEQWKRAFKAAWHGFRVVADAPLAATSDTYMAEYAHTLDAFEDDLWELFNHNVPPEVAAGRLRGKSLLNKQTKALNGRHAPKQIPSVAAPYQVTRDRLGFWVYGTQYGVNVKEGPFDNRLEAERVADEMNAQTTEETQRSFISSGTDTNPLGQITQIKSLELRKKYRSVKGLRRRIKRSSPGSTSMRIKATDMDACRKDAEMKGIKFEQTSADKVRMTGDDTSIDELARAYGVRNVKTKALSWDRWKAAAMSAIDFLAAAADIPLIAADQDKYAQAYSVNTADLEHNLRRLFDTGTSPKQAAELIAGKSLHTKDIDPFEYPPKGPPPPGQVICPTCKGTGHNYYGGTTTFRGGPRPDYCLTCGGTGFVPAGKSLKTKALDGQEEGMPDKDALLNGGDISVGGSDGDPNVQTGEGAETEKYGAQVIRRLHEDARILLEEYDEILGPLEHEEIAGHVKEKLEGLVSELEALEGLWGKHYKEYGDLEGAGEGAGIDDLEDETKGMDDETEEDVVGGDPEMGVEEADSGAEEEPTGDEVVEGMSQEGKRLSSHRTKQLKTRYKDATQASGDPLLESEGDKLGIEDGHTPGNERTKDFDAVDEADNEENIQHKRIGGGLALQHYHIKHLNNASSFLKELAQTDDWTEEHQKKSYYFHKTLEDVGGELGIEGPDNPGTEAESGSEMEMKSDFGSSVGAQGGRKDAPEAAGDPLLGSEGEGTGIEGVHMPGDEREHPVYGAAKHLKDLSNTTVFRDEHRMKSMHYAKSLEEFTAANSQDDNANVQHRQGDPEEPYYQSVTEGKDLDKETAERWGEQRVAGPDTNPVGKQDRRAKVTRGDRGDTNSRTYEGIDETHKNIRIQKQKRLNDLAAQNAAKINRLHKSVTDLTKLIRVDTRKS